MQYYINDYYYYCIIVSFTQGSHTHIPETNHFHRGYIVAAILSLLFMVLLCLVPALVLLFFYVSTFRSMCAVPSMAVFCSSLTSWFPGMSLTHFLNDLEMVPVFSNYYRYNPCFYIPHALYFYYYYYYYYYHHHHHYHHRNQSACPTHLLSI